MMHLINRNSVNESEVQEEVILSLFDKLTLVKIAPNVE
jgi:hypothetical protein